MYILHDSIQRTHQPGNSMTTYRLNYTRNAIKIEDDEDKLYFRSPQWSHLQHLESKSLIIAIINIKQKIRCFIKGGGGQNKSLAIIYTLTHTDRVHFGGIWKLMQIIKNKI